MFFLFLFCLDYFFKKKLTLRSPVQHLSEAAAATSVNDNSRPRMVIVVGPEFENRPPEIDYAISKYQNCEIHE